MNERIPNSCETTPLLNSLDYYKLTMGQLMVDKFAKESVTFTLKNRAGRPLSEHVQTRQLVERVEEMQQQGVSRGEREYLASLYANDGLPRFKEQYLHHLETLQLPEVHIARNSTTDDFDIQTTGDWPSVSLWETVVMSELNELYYQGKIAAEQMSLSEVYAEGDRRLTEKITVLQNHPDIKIADFGTRRRFSADWHEYVVDRLVYELPENFIGTSNPGLARAYNVPPIGTYAHEMPMVYAALSDARGDSPLSGHAQMLEDWQVFYKGDLSIALSDTFTTELFLQEFGEENAHAWQGVRHDSGDPYIFGERMIDFYQSYGIDPIEKTLVFSDGLDLDTIIGLADHFKGRIDTVFGWGTSLTNDVGIKANNFVMKAAAVGETSTVKLSDEPGKHTGTPAQVERYIALKDEQLHGVKI